jgi:hypothetical protein
VQFKVQVIALTESGEKIDLGIAQVSAADSEEASRRAIQERWEERLTCASCTVETVVLSTEVDSLKGQ